MNRNQIIIELYNTGFVEKYTRKIANAEDWANIDDFICEIWLIICEIPQQNIVDMYNDCGINCLRQYISGIIYKQIRSQNSKIFRKYKQHKRKYIPISQVENFEIIHREFEDKILNNKAFIY